MNFKFRRVNTSVDNETLELYTNIVLGLFNNQLTNLCQQNLKV